MATYTISERDAEGLSRAKWTVEAVDVERAAMTHLRYGPDRIPGAFPWRITGDHGKSGWFRPMRNIRSSASWCATSCGADFHVG